MTDIMTLNSPPSWQLYRLGQLFRERKEKGSDKDFLPLSVTMRGIVPQLETAAKTDDGDNRKVVRAGDYVINSRSDRKGSGGISDYDGSVSLISIVLEPRNINPRFAHHLLRSPAFQEEFYRWGHGIVADLWTTRYADMRNIRLRVPDLDTQKAIADFLDREIARIDQLIEKKQRLVETQKRRLQSKLQEMVLGGASVQRGLGDAWLQDLPNGWRLIPLKHLVSVMGGATPSKGREDFWVGDIPWVSPKDMKSDVIYDVPNHVSEAALADSPIQMIPEQTVLIVVRGMILARTVPVCRLDAPATINQDMKALLPRKRAVRGDYLQRMLQGFGDILMSFIEEAAHGTKKLRSDALFGLKFPVPPLDVQEHITDEYERARAWTEKVSAVTLTTIERLREYRSALITAAVTGQIDVKATSDRGAANANLDGIKAASTVSPASLNANPSQVRRLVAAEIIHDHRNVSYLGRIKVHKVMFLAEAHANINEINGRYVRQAAGPYDGAMINDVEAGLRQDRFYDAAEDPSSQRGRIIFTPLDNAGGHQPTLEAMLGDRVAELRRIIGLVQDFSTENTEAIATLYAVWNDALIDGEQPDDERIIRGFREEWHEAKQRFTEESLRTWLGWMRRHDLVPRGSGPHTISAHQPSLF